MRISPYNWLSFDRQRSLPAPSVVIKDGGRATSPVSAQHLLTATELTVGRRRMLRETANTARRWDTQKAGFWPAF
jgi:hypothetical protein